MNIQIWGTSWDLVALTIYLLTVFWTTNRFKKRFRLHPVYISWILGIPVFFTIGIFRPSQVTFVGVVQFFFLTLLLNGGVKAGHKAYDFLAGRFLFLKPRHRGNHGGEA